MRKTVSGVTSGFDYFLSGFRRLRDPAIMPFIIVPLTINVVVFGLVIWLTMQQFSNWVDMSLAWLPSWLDFLSWLLWPLFAFTVLLVIFFGFTLMSNLIAAPFNGFLAEKIQRQQVPGSMPPDTGWKGFLAMIPRSLARELQKLAYYLPRALLLLIITFIPGVNILSPVLWGLFGAWMMAVQYCDYAADNQLVAFRPMLDTLKKPGIQTLAFGGCVSLFTIIPIINLVVMPAAVIGGTLLWIDRTDNETALLHNI